MTQEGPLPDHQPHRPAGAVQPRDHRSGVSAARFQALLHERARQLARPEPGVGRRAPGAQLLAVRLGRESYGLELAGLAGVVAPTRSLPAPGGPPELLGLIAARGEIWAAFSLARLLEAAAAAESPTRGRLVLLRHPWRRIGLWVDEAEQVVAATDIAAPPEKTAGTARSLVRGMTSGRVILIDLDALWRHPSIAEVA